MLVGGQQGRPENRQRPAKEQGQSQRPQVFHPRLQNAPGLGRVTPGDANRGEHDLGDGHCHGAPGRRCPGEKGLQAPLGGVVFAGHQLRFG